MCRFAVARRRYGADPSLLGGEVRINGVPFTVVGIMPAGFAGLSDKSEMWIPRTMAPQLSYAEYLTTPQLFIAVVARLKDDVTLESASTSNRFLSEHDSPKLTHNAGRGSRAEPTKSTTASNV